MWGWFLSSDGSGTKLPGKTKWYGRRRPVTRRSGFTTRGSGSELEASRVGGFLLPAGLELTVTFTLPRVRKGAILGFGGWFTTTHPVAIGVQGYRGKTVLEPGVAPDWGKFGSQWYSDGNKQPSISVRFAADVDTELAFWGVLCGVVEHDYLQNARAALMRNMHAVAPEANFIAPSRQGHVAYSMSAGDLRESRVVALLYTKSCNRCVRFLPVNIPNERLHLSFSNHCSAAHRIPCRHPAFGKLSRVDSGEDMQLTFGFQLECRFCKKFEVNAAHNPQRTAAQMKEDAARRRAFELLLDHLYEGSPQLRYGKLTGHELADDVWQRFGHRCFKCGAALATPRDMHLDHTRPLALLWPLDGTATALCATHNSEKRDRPPSEFYSPHELARLAAITGIPLHELQDPSPNIEALTLLGERLDWFNRDFLKLPALSRTRDGKMAADLLVKALQKALAKCPGIPPFEL
jgi:hypothetical protein